MHLSNHALGIISVNAQEAARPYVMALWHSPPGQVLLYGSLTFHAMLGLYSMMRRRHYKIPLWECLQTAMGLAIPYFLLLHIVNTRGTRILTHIDINYIYEITNLWVDPISRVKQITLVLLVWGHFVMGLHFWLRIRPWYPRVFPVLVLFYTLVPAGGLVGFAEVGMTMTQHAQSDPAWYKAMKSHGVPKDANNAKMRAALKEWVGPAWLGIVGTAFLFGQVRNLCARRWRFILTYLPGGPVRAPLGMSILEVSRLAGRPHMSVCGGRARCTTCRVRVVQCAGDLPAPNRAEFEALQRIGAPPQLRLACQTRPQCDLSVHPLIHPSLLHPVPQSKRAPEFGQEHQVTVLFVDIRGSSQLAEARMPYDVVFLFNHFFAEMAAAVEAAGGHYANFTGDGLMALFGLRTSAEQAARSAIACAGDMLDRMDQINLRMADELNSPMSIGVGLHSGLAIVGRMGPPKTPLMTALGDTVNAAARVEGLSKELGAPIVISSDTLIAAGLSCGSPLHNAQLRGREGRMGVVALDREGVRSLLKERCAST
jgi:adenylate cyclase